MENDLTVREYSGSDLAEVSSWWGAHNPVPFPAALLPPVGVVVERDRAAVAACWLFMAVSVGICWLEYPVAVPGLSISEARRAFACAVAALEDIARAHDYGIMSAHTTPGIARELQKLGFIESTRNQIALAKVLK